MAKTDQGGGGFSHHHTDDELRRYRALPAEQKLCWLHAAWKLTVDFLPQRRRRAYQMFRRGEL